MLGRCIFQEECCSLFSRAIMTSLSFPLPTPPSGFQHFVKLFIMQPRSCCEAEGAQGLLSASHPTTGTPRAVGVLQNPLSASNGPSATFLGHNRRIPAKPHTLPAAPSSPGFHTAPRAIGTFQQPRRAQPHRQHKNSVQLLRKVPSKSLSCWR